MRVAVIGCGALARRAYLPALARLGAQVAVADPSAPARGAALQAWPAIEFFAGHTELLDRWPAAGRVDLALIATPPAAHRACWQAFSRRGIPVFVEKPLVAPAECGLLRPDDPDHRHLMIDLNRRFWPPYICIRDWLAPRETGALGALRRGCYELYACRPARAGHRADPANGGAMFDLGCHAIDWAWFVLGAEPDTITATRRGADDWSLELEFSGHRRLRLAFGYRRWARERVHLRGERGSIVLREAHARAHLLPNGARGSRLRSLSFDAVALARRALRRSGALVETSVASALARFFADAGRGGPFVPGLADWCRIERWLVAARHSAATGRPVGRAGVGGASG